jgi:ATP-dependent HslUV protease ATP-binding subunit HslU
MEMTPLEMVKALDEYIIGQDDAKQTIAVALRNRWRRQQLPEEVRRNVMSRNILLIGDTGIGKTEIARRLATITNAPFYKTEATNFTERGIVGGKVHEMVGGLCGVARRSYSEFISAKYREKLNSIVDRTIVDHIFDEETTRIRNNVRRNMDKATFQELKKEIIAKYKAGEYRDRVFKLSESKRPWNSGIDDITKALDDMFRSPGKKPPGNVKQKSYTMTELKEKFYNESVSELLAGTWEESFPGVSDGFLRYVEDNGIIFIDEIDKLAGGVNSSEVSREGVQRELLSIVEGAVVTTEYGSVKTDHMLFIAAGAFAVCKVSDLIPELRGRFPITVKLARLNKDALKGILVTKKNAILTESVQLLGVDGIDVTFTDEAIDAIVDYAWWLNEEVENLGARQLHNVMERILKPVAYTPNVGCVTITLTSVNEALPTREDKTDMSRYIL